MAGRRAVPALPGGPRLGGPGVVELLRRLPSAATAMTHRKPTATAAPPPRRPQPAGPTAPTGRRAPPRPPRPATPTGRPPRRLRRPPAAPRPEPPRLRRRAAPAPATGAAPRPGQPAPASPRAPRPEASGTGCAARPPGPRSTWPRSLAVPTATSVRAIPAKLLIDNRIVINNHLSRGRGGKVSFTHLIGYAVVRALAAVPEMNDSYAEDDGKPVLVQPEHVNLGLAIDIRQGRRVAPAPGAEHQGRRGHGLPPVLDRRTRTWSARPAPASSRSRTSPGPRSA